MNTGHKLKLQPGGRQQEVPAGAPLQDVLFTHGVEFPCGGRGRCKGCRVKMLSGDLPVGPEEINLLTAAELTDGWRLACRHQMAGDLEIELAQWEMPVLGDQSAFNFIPRAGLGVAIDLGTTTIAAQLVDLKNGNVLAVSTALNAQARLGADIMSRIDCALRDGGTELCRLVRAQLGQMVKQLLEQAGATEPVVRVVIVGNSVMHHIFCGLSVAPLATHPFEPEHPGRLQFTAAQLGWPLPGPVSIEFLPCLGGFVGSDVLAGIVATGLQESRDLVALLDLGTNGEVVVGNRDRILCASTAAGPAFEGARIAMGMRAATGAICAVEARAGVLDCRVIGGGEPRGLCGSGLVDAVAAGLDLKMIEPGGRMMVSPAMSLAGSIALMPADVRELQLAKGAIAAGLCILTARLGASPEDVQMLHLAGAFGNYISRASARRIGLLRLPLSRIVPAGNTALHGAKRALFEDPAAWDALAQRVEHVTLNEDPRFHDVYVEEMPFPAHAF
ncbi:MAG: ASKHA domain-containing protein [Verrucomicrobiae bacterium]|nr:ASKHA domain-containing protein [Verrucomicrobiae bacterium]